MLPEVAVVLVRVTLLFASAILFLRMSRGLPPQVRHLACMFAMCLALMTLLDLPIAALHPEYPVFTVRALEVPDVSGVRISQSTLWTWARLIWIVWACGFSAVLLRFVAGAVILRRARHNAVPIGADPGVLSADVTVPMVTGLFRPVILLPRDAMTWPEERRDAALRHERAHIARQDLRVNLFVLFVCAIYWFHPLAWMVFRRCREEQESACDELVVDGGFDRASYAQALVDAGRQSRPDRILIASCPMTRRGSVKERILRVLSERPRMSPKRLLKWQRAISGGSVLVFGLASALGTEPIYKVGGIVTNPVILRKADPVYPAEAAAAKIQGPVSMNMVVGDDGVPRDIVVTRGIDPGLDHSAVAAVRRWKLRPAMRNGTSVAVRAKVEVNFRLKWRYIPDTMR